MKRELMGLILLFTIVGLTGCLGAKLIKQVEQGNIYGSSTIAMEMSID